LFFLPGALAPLFVLRRKKLETYLPTVKFEWFSHLEIQFLNGILMAQDYTGIDDERPSLWYL
jgi:hypothetical protein